MRALMTGLVIFCCAISAYGEVFQMDRTGDSTVEVTRLDDEYRVTCMFKPQTKFDQGVNVKFNDAKGDSLCKKGLARYLKVGADEALVVSGQYSVAPVETLGGRLRYSFGIPVSGCVVSKGGARHEATEVQAKPSVAASEALQPLPSEVSVHGAQADEAEDSERSRSETIVQETSYMCVATYKEVNGERTTVSRREYQGRDFKSMSEFDQFCQQELARIRALGEANLRAVRNFGK